MDERIERFLNRVSGVSEKKRLEMYISPKARNIIWEDALRTQSSDKKQKSYVTKEYWDGRVKPALRTLLEKLYNNRDDLLPGLSENQVYSIASVVRKPFEESIRKIEPILGERRGDVELIPEDKDKLIISPAVALIYGIRDEDMVEFSSLKRYGKVRKQVKVEEFDGSAEFNVKLYDKDMKLIFGLTDVPQSPIDGEYKIRKMTGMKGKRTLETVV